MRIIAVFIISGLGVAFLVVPAALGYWYMARPHTEAFVIPPKYWAVPLLVLSLVMVGAVILGGLHD